MAISAEWFDDNEQWIGKDVEGNCCGLISIIIPDFPGGAEEGHDNLSQVSSCPSLYSGRASPSSKSETLLLEPASSVANKYNNQQKSSL
jgi:hypothetical protein